MDNEYLLNFLKKKNVPIIQKKRHTYLALLESGEFNHSESGEKRQFWSKEKSKHII